MPSVGSTWLRAVKLHETTRCIKTLEPWEPFETLHVQIPKPKASCSTQRRSSRQPEKSKNSDTTQTRLYIHTDIKSWDKNCGVGEQKWPTTCIRQRKQILSSMYLDQIRLQRWLGPWSHPERNQQQCGPGTWATLNCWEREPKKWILGCWDKGFGHLSYNIVPVWLYLSFFSCSSLMICCPTKRL